jgi:hypothetical protein
VKTVEIPEIPGILSREDLLHSAKAIAEVQRSDGAIPWFHGGHIDPWNHVEAAMALTICGLYDQADAAYAWLRRNQHRDGSWFHYYSSAGVESSRIDTNVCTYIGVGLWHRYLHSGTVDHLAENFSVVKRALDFVLNYVRDDGTIAWSIDPYGRVENYALLTGSASIALSLRCAIESAHLLTHTCAKWQGALARLTELVGVGGGYFATKREFAMDWYYPILSGSLRGISAQQALFRTWTRFVIADLGVRCVASSDWVTAGESAECAIACHLGGEKERGLTLLQEVQALRRSDGAYLTGVVHPHRNSFPRDEITTYSSAAMILAVSHFTEKHQHASLWRSLWESEDGDS